jgi:hypothetical protein
MKVLREATLAFMITSAAYAGELGTDFNLPGSTIYGSPPTDTTPFFDPSERGGGTHHKVPSLPPVPNNDFTIRQQIDDVQQKITQYRNSTNKLQILIGFLSSIMFPHEQALIYAGIAMYNVFSSEDSKEEEEWWKGTFATILGVDPEMMKIYLALNSVDTMAERDLRGYDANSTLVNGEKALMKLSNDFPREIKKLVNEFGEIRFANNCHRNITYTFIFERPGGVWTRIPWQNLMAGDNEILKLNGSPVLTFNNFFYIYIDPIFGSKVVASGAGKEFVVDGIKRWFASREAYVDGDSKLYTLVAC